ncbi:3 exoribonuclease family protein [Coniochaeta hoffmannii]|uniref:3 exoribonuclease family protein n=1 Tax=Coniochaeta hoffmannii TaxID=91930 RepID=A0AA38RPL0_9PEZI|nr:3 exoribonuclease family protein [Coniochaeta hoffmannii]
MARHAKPKGSRAIGASARPTPIPTPIPSALTTPLSSAYPSTYASEAEWDPEDDPTLVAISKLTLGDDSTTPGSSSLAEKPTAPKQPQKPFPFMLLPSELRCKVYGYHFADSERTIDLDPANYKLIHKKLGLLRVCRTIYAEASHYFYSTRSFRIFPTCPGRFFKTKKPLLARLNARQRSCITSLELRLGPGWSMPPRGWVVNPALGLKDCANVRYLTVFVECDPSDGVFKGFRRADGFYEMFSRNLLEKVLAELPQVDRVFFDAWSSVKKSGSMMRTLFDTAVSQGRKICYGPERGWSEQDDDEDVVQMKTALITYSTSDVLVVA